MVWSFFFFQAEDGIRDLVRSRGLGDVYKRQMQAVDNVINVIGPKLIGMDASQQQAVDDVIIKLDLSLIHI